MLVRVLGPVEVANGDGWIGAGPPKQACVLAALALSPDMTLSHQALANRVWSGTPPDSARGIIYGHLTRLRKLLAGHEAARLVRVSGAGYRLDLPDDAVDVLYARRLAVQAGAAAEADDHRRSARLWREAAELWRGPALSGLGGQWAQRTRMRLRQEYLRVATGRFASELALGRHADVVGDLEELCARFPQSETAAAQLMLALYRSGRAGDAGACYAQIRRRLRSELGADPGEALQQLHSQILRQDPRLGTAFDSEPHGETAAPAHAQSEASRPRQLPAAAAVFTGREDQMADLAALLKTAESTARPGAVVVAAIDGMAGVGKTTLAVHAAAAAASDFPDGQLFVDLHGFSADMAPVSPSEALDRMLRALGTPASQIPDALSERAASFRSALADKRMLIVLDNVRDEEQVEPLLPGAAGCPVVITSRRKLAGLDNATTVSLDILGVGEAIDLFDRISRRDADSGSSLATVSQTVELCGRLPLAIRVAAARLRSRPSWGVGDLRDRLLNEERRLGELRAGQRGVERAFSVSVQDLSAESRKVFCLLGAAPGLDFSVAAVAALAGTPSRDAESILEELVDANLLRSLEPGRYGLHDLLRLYAGRRGEAELDAVEQQAAWRRLHSWYLHSAAAASGAAGLFSNDWISLRDVDPAVTAEKFDHAAAAWAWLEAERVNLLEMFRAAVALERFQVSWQLVEVVSEYLELSSDVSARAEVAEIGLRAAQREGDRNAQALMHLRRGVAAFVAADYGADAANADRALQLAGPHGNPRVRSWAMSRRAAAAANQGLLGEAAQYARQAVEVELEQGGDRLPTALNIAGAVASESGDLRSAVQFFQEAVSAMRAVSGSRVFTVLTNLGMNHVLLGEPDTALEYLLEAEAAAHDVGELRTQAAVQDNFAQLHLLRGEPDHARQRAQAAVDLAHQAGSPHQLPHLSATLARTFLSRPEEAERLALEALQSAEASGAATAKMKALIVSAEASVLLGRLPAALASAKRAVDMAQQRQCRLFAADAMTVEAEARLASGESAAARVVGGEALARHRGAGHRPGEVRTRRLLARACAAEGDTAAAREHATAVEALEASMGLTTSKPAHERSPSTRPPWHADGSSAGSS